MRFHNALDFVYDEDIILKTKLGPLLTATQEQCLPIGFSEFFELVGISFGI